MVWRKVRGVGTNYRIIPAELGVTEQLALQCESLGADSGFVLS
jgi:hypothetical protein